MKARVLIFAQSRTQLNELQRAARVLEAGGRYEVAILTEMKPIQPQNKTLPSRRLRTSFAGILVRSLAKLHRFGVADASVVTLNLCWANDAAEMEKAGYLLDDMKPALILVGEDGLGGPLHVIAAARDRKIPVVVVPYEFSTRVQIMRHINDYGRHTHRVGRDVVSRVMIRLMPDWVAAAPDGRVTRIPPPLALSYWLHAIAPEKPWTVHGGAANKIAVESTAMHAHYLREGLPPEKLEQTGALANDELHASIRADAALSRAFDDGRKISNDRTRILCALPPSYLPERAEHSEFKSYADLVGFWLDVLTAHPDVDLTVQLHPAISPKDAEVVRARATVSESNIVDLIIRTDILVTSVSSIIRYAICSRKPVVNYDVYGFGNPDYVGAPGVANVADAAAFRDAIDRLVDRSTFFSEVAQHQRQEGHQWGVLDGMAGKRFSALVDKLTQNSQLCG